MNGPALNRSPMIRRRDDTVNIPAEFQRELSRFPEVLRSLVAAELDAGNTITEVAHSFPAPPVGACIRLARQVSTRPRQSGAGLDFFERYGSSHSGEFTDSTRCYFVLEPPALPEADPAATLAITPPQPRLDHLPESGRFADQPASAPAEPQSPPETPPTKRVPDQPPVAASTGTSRIAESFLCAVSETGQTWQLDFRDRRAPEEVRAALEQRLMAPLVMTVEDGRLTMRADFARSGVRFRLRVRFESASSRRNRYSLRAEARWNAISEEARTYCRQVSHHWIDLWIDGLKPLPSRQPAEAPSSHYRQRCDSALAAEAELGSVSAVQAAILAGMRHGATLETAHHEGGTEVRWLNGRFIRRDYGEHPATTEFIGETEFLDFLHRFFSPEVARNELSAPLSETEIWRLILRRLRPQ